MGRFGVAALHRPFGLVWVARLAGSARLASIDAMQSQNAPSEMDGFFGFPLFSPGSNRSDIPL